MKSKLAVPFVALVIGILAALASYQLIKNLQVDPEPLGRLVVIGQLTEFEGEIDHRLPRSIRVDNVKAPIPVHSQELLITQRDSGAIVRLENGTVIRLNDNTRFIAEVDSAREGAYIGTVLDGSINVFEAGKPNSFRVFRGGREIDLKALAPSATGKALILPSRPPPLPTAEEPTTGLTITATTPEDATPTPTPSAKVTPNQEQANSGEVLTNEDILRTLRGQTGFFQRCYLTYINRGRSSTGGKILVNFTVQSNGRVKEATVFGSDFNDPTLHKCITEVIERAQFKAFDGADVPVLEFPITLQ